MPGLQEGSLRATVRLERKVDEGMISRVRGAGDLGELLTEPKGPRFLCTNNLPSFPATVKVTRSKNSFLF